jgi:hypothetical protein
MSVNDSTLAGAARKLHRLAPHVIFDNAKQINDLMVDWWDKHVRDAIEIPDDLTSDEDHAVNLWIIASFEGKKR